MLVKCVCGASITIESRHLGKKIACPQCKRKLRVADSKSNPQVRPSLSSSTTFSDSDISEPTPISTTANPLPKTQAPKIDTRSNDLPMRLRASEMANRQTSGYYRPGPRKKSNDTFKFLMVCAMFLIGLCILGGFGLVGLKMYQNQAGAGNDPVVAQNDNPDQQDAAANINHENTSSNQPLETSSDSGDQWSRANPGLARAGVRAHSGNSTNNRDSFSRSPSAGATDVPGTPNRSPNQPTGVSPTNANSPTKATETIVKGNGESFEADTEEAVARSFATGGMTIMGIQISPDGKYLGANSLDGVVYVFDMKKGKLLYKIISDQKLIRAIAFSENESLYTLRDQDIGEKASIAVRSPEDGTKIGTSIGASGGKRANNLAVSTDGRSVFACWQDFSQQGNFTNPLMDIKFWRFSAIGDEVKVFDLENAFRDTETYRAKLPSCSKFTKDGRMLINGFEDGWVGASTGAGSAMNLVASKRLHEAPVVDIAISPNGEKMVTGCEAGFIQLTSLKSSSWSSKTLNRDPSAGDVLGVAVSSNNQLVAASRANRTIEIYDVDSRKLVDTLRPSSLCTDLEFMRGDQFLVAGGKDGKIRILPIKK